MKCIKARRLEYYFVHCLSQFLHFSSTTSLWSLSEILFRRWTNCCLFTIYIYIYIPRFLSESERGKDDKKRGRKGGEKRKRKINKRDGAKKFLEARLSTRRGKNSIAGVFRVKHDPTGIKRADSSFRRGRERATRIVGWIDRFIICGRFVIRVAPPLCAFGIEISTPPAATIFSAVEGRWQDHFISLNVSGRSSTLATKFVKIRYEWFEVFKRTKKEYYLFFSKRIYYSCFELICRIHCRSFERINQRI